MISTRYTAIIAVAAFVSGSFVASPELRAYAAATITSADIVNETIRTVDIKDGEVKSPDIGDGAVRSIDIGTDQVTDEDLEGDTTCDVPGFDFEIGAGDTFDHNCATDFSGGLDGTFAIATMNDNIAANCFTVMGAQGFDDEVTVLFKNVCDSAQSFDGAQVSILVFR
jgi:hypothetical protein